MNQLEIRKQVNELIKNAETDLELVFAKMLREVLFDIEKMYKKHQVKGELSYTDLNKYNRMHSLFERITEMVSSEYKIIINEITKMQETVYVETYLQHAYLFEVFSSIDMGFQVPSSEVINAALINPIEFLSLPKILTEHRNQIVRDLQILITQSLIRGDSYWDLAREIERKMGFSRTKAITVARTEAGRAQSIAAEKASEQASKYAKMNKMWASSLDFRVRSSHGKLDGQRADKDGYFHYRGLKAKGPLLWMKADMDINCRCIVIHLVKGMLPTVRRGRNFNDPDYQKRFRDMVKKYMDDEDLTFAQALSKADKNVNAPSVLFDSYISYEDWYKKMTA